MPLQSLCSVIFYRDMQHILSSSTFRIIFLFAALSAVVYGQKTKAPAWYSLDSKDGGFSIKFPQKPKFETDTILDGTFTTNTYSYGRGMEFDFGASYVEFRGLTDDQLKGEFDVMAKGAFLSMKQAILSNKPVISNGCSGREYTGEGVIYKSSRVRFFNSGQRLFMISVKALKNDSRSQAVMNYFLDSFRVFDGCTGGFDPVRKLNPGKTEYIDGILDAETGWRKLTSVKGEFQALVPGRIEVETQEVMVQPMAITETTYSSYDGATSYVILTKGELPAGMLTKARERYALDFSEKGFRKEFETEATRIIFVRNIIRSGFGGREFSVESPTHIGLAQIFVTKKRSYLFITVGERKRFSPALSNRFFSSIGISVK